MKSEWRRWDLHVHTPESFQHSFAFTDAAESEKYNGVIFDKYIDFLEDLTEVECIGITDYFSIDGYKKIWEARKNGRLQNFKLVLPNIEFRLNTVLEIGSDKKSKKINFHVIFSDDIDPNIIENEFLNSLNFEDEVNSKFSVRRDSLERFGQRVKSMQPDFAEFSDYAAGCISASVDLSDIVKILNDKKNIFYGKYILVLAAENLSRIQWASQGHMIRRQLMSHSHAVFSGNPSDRDFLLGKKAVSAAGFLTEFKKYWPVIHGSDAHSFDKVFKPDLNRYCWIKSEPTFEGLKQIIHEPMDRVFISEACPDFSAYPYSIEKIEINSSSENSIINLESTSIELSKGLVAIIGGKGSGKTAFLDILAHCFESRHYSDLEETERLSSFVARNTNPKIKSSVSLNSTLILTDGTAFTKDIRSKETHKAGITYLPQGKIDEYSNDSSQLQKKIREIVFEKVLITNPSDVEHYELCKIEISNIIKSISDGLSDLKVLYFDLNQFDEKAIRDGIIDKRAVVKTIQSSINDLIARDAESRETFNKLVSEQSTLNNKIQRYRNARRSLHDLKRDINSFEIFNTNASQFNLHLEDLDIAQRVALINQDVIESSIMTIDSIIMDLNISGEAQLSRIRSEVELLSKSKSEIESLQKRQHDENIVLNDLLSKLDTIRQKAGDIEKARALQSSRVTELFRKHNDLRDAYSRIIAIYSSSMPDLLEDISFEAEVNLDFDDWFDKIASLYYSKQGSALEDVQRCFSGYEENCSQPNEDNIKNCIHSIIESDLSFKKNRNILDLEHIIYNPPVQIKTQIKYLGREMDSLSMGQRGTVLLNIYLADGDNTLVIDQPEENLDNKYIYDVLASSIRTAKKKRQIIIATHNANLVVNTDAEQVIIADYNGEKITYKSGVIEDPATRDEITLILEGGAEAFKKREMRYRKD